MKAALAIAPIALTVAVIAGAIMPSQALAQSARYCATERAFGRYPAGCPRPTAARPGVSPTIPVSRPRVRAEPALSRGALAMRAALAAVPRHEWLAHKRADQLYREIWSLGTLDDMRALAETGNVRALVLIGSPSVYGASSVPHDLDLAMRWLRRAASASDGRAMVYLGEMYSEGKGVARDVAQAVTWYRRGAAAGDGRAMAQLGAMYSTGIGTRLDLVQALAWTRRGVAAGNALAMSNLGIAYAEGLGVSRDDAEAARWESRARQAGYTRPIYGS